MPIDTLTATGADPLTAIADAMDAAFEAAKGRGALARITIGDLVPTGRFLRRAIYQASYAVSFGVVLPAVLIARAIPRRNLVSRGLIDGAQAAMQAVHDRHATDRPGA